MMNLGDLYLSIPYIARVMDKDLRDYQINSETWLKEAEELGG